MKTPSRMVFAVLLCAGVWRLGAQTAAPAPSTTTKAEDEAPVVLSPFEVTAEKDNGYQATETLAGTRIRTELKDVGSAISVYTKEFLKDIGATDSSTLLQYTTNAEVAGTRGTYAGLGNGTSVDETSNLRAPAGAQRVRGLASADNTRDFFATDIPWDSFNVDRIDIQRGPNSTLFGLGSPAGIVNASIRAAEFRNRAVIETRVGSYGSVRNSVDYNQVVIPKVLAIRIDGLYNDEKYQQDYAYQKDKRLYGAIRFTPQLFKNPDFRTTIKANYEHGDIDANRPRIVTPNDSITPWFRAVNNGSADGGMGKYSVNNGYEIGAQPTTISPWLAGVGDQQQPLWIVEGNNGQLQRVYAGYINTGARNSDGSIRTSGQSLLGQRFSGTYFGLTSFSSYATNAGLPGAQYGQYRTMSLRDPSVFDFYNKLLDGPTKNEWENWDAYNFTLTQTGWNDRLGFEFNYDRQKYERGGQALITNPTITIDVLRNFQDLTANPNYGRPFVVGGPGGGNSYKSDRRYLRGSLFGEVRTRDFFGEGLLTKILGKHRLNAVYSDEKYSTENRSWQMYANDQAWAGYWNRTDGSTSSIADRPPLGVIYLGGSLANATSAAGADISGIKAPVGLSNSRVYFFDSTWNAPSTVAFNAPWTVPSNLTPIFDSNATTQASNPANYVGWNSNYTINLMRYNNGEDPRLLTRAQKSLRVTKSLAGSWQAYLWQDAIVATFGFRTDEVKGKSATALPVSTNRSILNISEAAYSFPADFPANQILKDHSVSASAVVHLNKLLKKDRLPLNVSLSYSESDNFQVTDTRRNIYGQPIGNPTGTTKDYGVLLSTKDGKYSFRAVQYKTSVSNASTTLNPDGLGRVVQQGLRFRNVFLYKLSNYPWTTREQSQDRNTWATAWVNAAGRPVAAGSVASGPAGSTLETQAQADAHRDASIRAWNEIQKTLAAKGYFGAWGYTPTTAGALTDRATYEATLNGGIDPSAAFQPDPATVFAYAFTTPQGFAVTADTESKGYEFELTANPTRSLRLAFNASQTTATRMNVGGALLDEFVSYMDTQIAGVAGDMRQFSGGYVPGNEVRAVWNSWRGQYTLMKLQEGAAASELRKWRYNIVANYSFLNGALKGTGVGASYRWQDKVVIGYPVTPGANGQASFDLSKPYYGPAEDAIDLWANYERKLTKKINWKIQLNIRNAFAKDGLIPISVQPDGQTWASVRVKPVQEWYVTNTFSF
jgi:hypothetical protein